MGPLLFSLVVLQLLDDIGKIPKLHLQLWYLDDGTFAGDRDAVSTILQSLWMRGPAFGLHVNLDKCEVFWPSSDQTFPELPAQVRRLSDGVELLGSPVYGTDEFFKSSVAKRIDKVLDAQSHLNDLENP